MLRYACEAAASAAFTMAWCRCAASDAELAALGPGLALAVILVVLPTRSGCNPAVALALWITGRMTTSDVAGTVTAQLLGAAAAVTAITRAGAFPPAAAHEGAGTAAVIAEGVVAAALTAMVLDVRPGPADRAIGLPWVLGTVVCTASVVMAAGSLSGFNPSTTLAAALTGWIGWPAACASCAAALAGATAAAALRSLGSWPRQGPGTVAATRPRAHHIPRPRSAIPRGAQPLHAADPAAAGSL